MPVYISTLPEGKTFSEVDLQQLEHFANALLQAVGRPDLELSIVLTDDETIRELNKKWRNKDKPTDVLSFPQNFPDRDIPENVQPQEFVKQIISGCKNCQILGDIVVSVDTAKRQASQYGWSLNDELKRLILHGFTHLLGLDHEKNQQQERKFKEIEEYLLSKVEEKR
jgi:probable rRNA maturation factor